MAVGVCQGIMDSYLSITVTDMVRDGSTAFVARNRKRVLSLFQGGIAIEGVRWDLIFYSVCLSGFGEMVAL